MQYVDKNGNIHDLPLASVQPIVSPDTDNLLYESANGLKVDKSSAGNSLRTRVARVEIPINKTINANTYQAVTIAKQDIWDALNLAPGERIWGGSGTKDDVMNYARFELFNGVLQVGYLHEYLADYIDIPVANTTSNGVAMVKVYFTYFIYWFE